MKLAVIDFETTGSVQGFENEPWQVGLVYLIDGEICLEGGLDLLIRVDPNRPFNPMAPGRHRELRNDLAVAAPCSKVLERILELTAGCTPAAHNAATERTLLSRLAPLHRWGDWMDSLKLARTIFPALPEYGLESLIERLDIKNEIGRLCPGRTSHDAYYDAVACAVLLKHMGVK